MRKIILPLVVLSIIFAGCKKKPEDLGTITLDKVSVNMVYGQEINLMPTLKGAAQTNQITWTSSNTVVATVKEATGGVGKVSAKRVGETEIKIEGDDKNPKTPPLVATCKVSVEARTKILGNIYYKKGATATDIGSAETGVKNTAESTPTVLVYDRTPTSVLKVTKVIYQLDNNKQLKSTLAIVPLTNENKEQLEKFLEERYDTYKTIGPILYYNTGNVNAAAPKQDSGTMAGIFLNTADLGDGLKFDLGVKFTDETFIK